jgi:hypothetical protein
MRLVLPATGHIHILHKITSAGATDRIFTGNISDDVSGQTLFMGGTMVMEISAFENLGEYDFSVVSQ